MDRMIEQKDFQNEGNPNQYLGFESNNNINEQSENAQQNVNRALRAMARFEEHKQKIKKFLVQLKIDESEPYVKIFWQQYHQNRHQVRQRWEKEKEKIRQNLAKGKKNYIIQRIREETVRQVYSFLTQYKSQIKIFCHPLSQDLKIQLHINKQICESAFHLYQLSHTMKKHLQRMAGFSETSKNEINDEQVAKKIEQLFSGLIDCLIFLLKQEIKKKNLKNFYSFDFLCFPRSYKEFKTAESPIFIGGLKYHCLRFFRTLMIVIFEHKQLISKQMQLRQKEWNNNQKNFNIPHTSFHYMAKKVIQMRDFNKNAEQIANIKKQSKARLFAEVLQNYYDQLKNLKLAYQYDSAQSQKIYQLNYAFYIIDKQSAIRTSAQIDQDDKLRLINIKFTGQLISQYRSQQPFINLALIRQHTELFPVEQSLQNDLVQQQYHMQNCFIGTNNLLKITLILYKSGEFCLMKAGTQKFANLKKQEDKLLEYMQNIQLIYEKRVPVFQKLYCYQGKFTSQFNFNIFKQIYKDNITGKLIGQAQTKFFNNERQFKQIRQSTKNRVYQHDFTLMANFQNYVRFTGQYTNSSDRLSRKKSKIVIDITADGYFRVNGPKSQTEIKNFIDTIYSDIKEFQTQMKKKKDPNELQTMYLPMNITGNPHKSQFYKQTLRPIKQVTEDYKITPLGLGKVLGRFPGIQSLKVHQFTILIWNIQGGKYDKDKYQYPDRIPDFQKWKNTRIKLMIQLIRQHNPDFICLQQSSDIYRKYSEFILPQLLKNSQNRPYYYSDTYTKHIYASNNIQSSRRYSRTMILSRAPAKFYDLYFPKILECNNMTFCEFTIDVKGKPRSAILFSIHLKAFTQFNKERKQQLDIIKKITENFQVVILAGDFNIGQNPQKYPENEQLNIYRDLDEFFELEVKPITCVHPDYPNNRFDRILMKIRDPLLDDALYAIPQQLGNATCKIFQDQYYIESIQRRQQTGLSDHYGRFDRIRFKK